MISCAKADYPWVKSLGEQAQKDSEALRMGSLVLVDGSIQAKNSFFVKRKCDYCDADTVASFCHPCKPIFYTCIRYFFSDSYLNKVQIIFHTKFFNADDRSRHTFSFQKQLINLISRQKGICSKYSVYSVRSDRTRILYVQNAEKRIHTKELLLLFIL